MTASARRGSGSVSASSIRSASRSGLTASGSRRAASRFVVGCQVRFRAIHDRERPGRSVHEPLEQLQSVARPDDRQQPRRRKAAPAFRRVLDALRREVLGELAKPLLPAREQTARYAAGSRSRSPPRSHRSRSAPPRDLATTRSSRSAGRRDSRKRVASVSPGRPSCPAPPVRRGARARTPPRARRASRSRRASRCRRCRRRRRARRCRSERSRSPRAGTRRRRAARAQRSSSLLACHRRESSVSRSRRRSRRNRRCRCSRTRAARRPPEARRRRAPRRPGRSPGSRTRRLHRRSSDRGSGR